MSLGKVNEQITACSLCPRLLKHIRKVGDYRPQRYSGHTYWAKPVPSFGDPKARLLIIGLAPAANGGNRTGRMFTGDSSGEWLMKAMFETGFANVPNSVSIDDGLCLSDAYVTSMVKCAPPMNKPTNAEISNCSLFLRSELDLLKSSVVVVITLGKMAFDTYCKLSDITGLHFKHNSIYQIDSTRTLIVSYHPSMRNTNTGTLTWPMWIQIFEKAKSIIETKL
ncbi:MAG: uracil-DNA glycosylase [Candidatus Nitrosocosmicus sp.]|nr:uracil-DNA glycosylase [Candidatus Nitrosocosmicus sp.]MDN5866902.1 uracil-DNA glycosylase [Candidatus Nitrosocosmicus sp.]